jgi:hypothetical protein
MSDSIGVQIGQNSNDLKNVNSDMFFREFLDHGTKIPVRAILEDEIKVVIIFKTLIIFDES